MLPKTVVPHLPCRGDPGVGEPIRAVGLPRDLARSSPSDRTTGRGS
jgi:hypothetical protein